MRSLKTGTCQIFLVFEHLERVLEYRERVLKYREHVKTNQCGLVYYPDHVDIYSPITTQCFCTFCEDAFAIYIKQPRKPSRKVNHQLMFSILK